MIRLAGVKDKYGNGDLLTVDLSQVILPKVGDKVFLQNSAFNRAGVVIESNATVLPNETYPAWGYISGKVKVKWTTGKTSSVDASKVCRFNQFEIDMNESHQAVQSISHLLNVLHLQLTKEGKIPYKDNSNG